MKRFTRRKVLPLIIISFLAVNLFLFSFIILRTNKSSSHPKINLHEGYIYCLDGTKKPLEKGQCLRELAKAALTNYSTNEIASVIHSIGDSNQRQWCHEFMHYVGWGLYQKTHSVFDAFSQASGECDSGMYHGIVEEYINKTQTNYDPEKFVIMIPKVCENENSKKSLPSAMKALCYHGLGHAFMLITDNDLNKSLQYCDYLSSKESCYTGAFMENTQSKQVGRSPIHPSKFVYDLNNPDYPCNILDVKYKDQCYIYKGISNVVQTSGDFKVSFQDCLKVTSEYQEQCFWGVGSDIPGPHWDTHTAAEKCSVALDVSSNAYEQCIWGAMSFVIQLNLGNPKAALEFCDVVNENYKSICFRAAGRSLGGWVTSKDTLEDKCVLFKEVRARELCQNPDSS